MKYFYSNSICGGTPVLSREKNSRRYRKCHGDFILPCFAPFSNTLFPSRSRPCPKRLQYLFCPTILKCLEYANYDMAGAIKVCSTFCQFRLKEGWDLVLSARELETPLRSRVHTLMTNRDR